MSKGRLDSFDCLNSEQRFVTIILDYILYFNELSKLFI